MKPLILLSVLSLPLAASSFASPMQTPVRRGIFAVDQHGFSLSDTASTLGSLRYKPLGDQTSLPAAMPLGVGGLDYSLAGMFPGHFQLVDIDALSTGNDALPINSQGQVVPGSDRWAALILSVRAGATGGNAGWLQQRAAGPQAARIGGDLISYIFDGSSPTAIAPGVIGRNFIEQRSEDIGLGPTDEIDALDWWIPQLSQTGGAQSVPFVLETGVVYFSVTKASALQLAAASPAFFPAGAVPSGASIFRIDWIPGISGGAAAHWSAPTQVLSPYDLGFTSSVFGISNRELDALAVSPNASRIVFSTEMASDPAGYPQLNVLLQSGSGYLRRELTKNASGDSIPPDADLSGPDDVDAICGLDPEAGLYSHWISTPYAQDGTEKVGLSLAREVLVPGSEGTILAQISGWGDFGPLPNSSAQIFYTLDAGNTWGSGKVHERSAAEFTLSEAFDVPKEPAGLTIPVYCAAYAQITDPLGNVTTSGIQVIRIY